MAIANSVCPVDILYHPTQNEYSSGRVKQAALNCAEKNFDDEERQGMPLLKLAATMAEVSIGP